MARMTRFYCSFRRGLIELPLKHLNWWKLPGKITRVSPFKVLQKETVASMIDRRGAAPIFRTFSSPEALYSALQNSIDRQRDQSLAKKEQAWHWGDVGDWEEQAVEAAQQILNSVDRSLPVESQIQLLHTGLSKAAGHFRADGADSDGYALATIHEITSVLLDSDS